MAGKHSISAFFPAYNDVDSIGKIIHTMAWLLPKLTDDYEIVVVNDVLLALVKTELETFCGSWQGNTRF